MNDKNSNKMAGQKEQYRPSRVREIFTEYVNNSQDDFAQAFRKHLAEAARQKAPVSWVDFATDALDDDGFLKLFCTTEPCIDLKLITRNPGRLAEGEYLAGTILRDGEEHYTFIEDIDNLPAAASATCPVKAIQPPRNPIIYRGTYINVHRAKDGTLYPTFCRPLLNDGFTIADFCREAACELFDIAGRVEKWKPGMSA